MRKLAEKCLSGVAVIAIALMSAAAVADDYPSRPIKLIVPFAPGGGNDIVGRLVALKLQERVRQPVIVENKPGAGGNIGSEFVARAAPDGYTLLLATNTLTINPGIYKSLPFDVVKDFAPVAVVATTPLIVVTAPGLPVHSIPDLVALAKKSPRSMTYASPGTGTPHHLATELFAATAGIELTHVPYKGAAQTLQSVATGETQFTFAATSSSMPFITDKRVNAIATSAATRFSSLPDTPTMQEQGIANYDVTVWYGVLAPARTPPAVVNALSAALNAIVQEPDLKARMRTNAMEPATSTPKEMQALIAADLSRWAEAVKRAKITPE